MHKIIDAMDRSRHPFFLGLAPMADRSVIGVSLSGDPDVFQHASQSPPQPSA